MQPLTTTGGAAIAAFLALTAALPAAAQRNESGAVTINGDALVMISVKGTIAMPGLSDEVYRITANGNLQVMPGTGGSTYNFRTGDYDIQFFDPETVEEYGLDTLRFGDIVAIIDADSTYGRVYRQGAITIGAVSHGRSDSAGHGPGVTTLFTSREGNIEAYRKADANLAVLLEIRKPD